MTRSNIKREAILSAAISEFKANGFQTTSMDQIALTAQVSKRTVYNHFASKDLLFDAILAKMLSLFITSISVKYDAQTSLEKQLMDIGEQEIRLLSDRTFVDLAKVCMAEAMHSPHRINEALAEVANRDGDLCSWITAAKADNRLQVLDPEFAANQFFALIKGFCFWPQVVQGHPFPSTEQQQQILSSAVSMFLSQYSQPY